MTGKTGTLIIISPLRRGPLFLWILGIVYIDIKDVQKLKKNKTFICCFPIDVKIQYEHRHFFSLKLCPDCSLFIV